MEISFNTMSGWTLVLAPTHMCLKEFVSTEASSTHSILIIFCQRPVYLNCIEHVCCGFCKYAYIYIHYIYIHIYIYVMLGSPPASPYHPGHTILHSIVGPLLMETAMWVPQVCHTPGRLPKTKTLSPKPKP